MGTQEETTPLLAKPSRRPFISTALKVRILTSVISLIEGYDIGVVNGAVVLFKEDLNLSSLQVSVALSIFPLGVALCSPGAASVADKYGRKPTMIISLTLLILGGLCMASANGFAMLALGRLTCGSGVGIGLTAVTAYMSEVAPASHRGLFGSLEELFVNLGNVVGYLANFALLDVEHNWRWMLGGGVPPLFFTAVILLLPERFTGIPESPRFLYKKGRVDEAMHALGDLLGEDPEHEEVQDAVRQWNLEDALQNKMATWSEALKAFCGERRDMALAGIGVGVLNMWTGIMLMMVTTTTLLVGAGMTKKEAMKASICIGLAKVTVMLIVCVFFLDVWGRRPLLLTSLSVCTAVAAVGAAAAQWSWGNMWIVSSLCLFVTGYSFGVGPVPWVYMPEVLDSRYRGKGCALGVSGARLCAVTQLFCFPIVYPMVGIAGVFTFLVTANIVGFIYVWFFCKETAGEALEDIRSLFPPTPSMEKLNRDLEELNKIKSPRTPRISVSYSC